MSLALEFNIEHFGKFVRVRVVNFPKNGDEGIYTTKVSKNPAYTNSKGIACLDVNFLSSSVPLSNCTVLSTFIK